METKKTKKTKKVIDPVFRLSNICRVRINIFLNQKGYKKTSKTFNMILDACYRDIYYRYVRDS